MAKFTPGPMVSAISGSQGGTTFSRNPYGAYTRTRAIPTVSTTQAATNAKARFTTASQAWNGLTAAQRLSWEGWAAQNPVVDALGQQQQLKGNAAYIRINALLDYAGESPLSAPPITDPPTALTDLSQTLDIGAGTFLITFAATPLAADDVLVSRVAVVDSGGITYVQNYMRLVDFSAKAQATGLDIQTEIEAVFGTLVVGQFVHLECFVLDTATGLRSRPRKTSGVVVST
jgi:hypothetical protein